MKGERDGYPVFQLWISKGRPGLGSRVGEGANLVVFTLLTTTCARSVFTQENLGISRWTSLAYFLFKPRSQLPINTEGFHYWTLTLTQIR